MPLPTNGHKPVIVIVELIGLPMGLIVDKVTDVTKMAEAAIEPPSPLLTSVDTAYLRGIGKFKERLVILLDLGRVFSLEEKQDPRRDGIHQVVIDKMRMNVKVFGVYAHLRKWSDMANELNFDLAADEMEIFLADVNESYRQWRPVS